MSWAEERRADRVAEREQARADLLAAAEVRARERVQLAELAAQERTRRRTEREQDREGRASWLSEHSTELLIYPMAAVCAAMAVPAMASYGMDLYGNAAGAGLPVLSELGMWAFAGAVQVSRRKHPERPTSGFVAGIFVFAAVGAVLNFLHGLEDGGAVRGVVMAIVSVAGVVAHQLVVASPRRSRVERAERRLDRLAGRRLVSARRTAIRRAGIDLAGDGTAQLVYTPGRTETAAPRLRLRRVALSPVREMRAWRRQVLAATDPDITRVLRTLQLAAADTAAPAATPRSDTAVPAADTAALPRGGRADLALPAGPPPQTPTAPRRETAPSETEEFEAPNLAPIAGDETAVVSRRPRPARVVSSRSGSSRSETSRTAVGETPPGGAETSRPASRSETARPGGASRGTSSRSASRSDGTPSRRAEMTAWALKEREAGRTVTGADLDREFGTRDYGRTVLRGLRDGGATGAAPEGGAGTAREALDAARARAARDAAPTHIEPGGAAAPERDTTPAAVPAGGASDSGAVPDGTADLVGARS